MRGTRACLAVMAVALAGCGTDRPDAAPVRAASAAAPAPKPEPRKYAVLVNADTAADHKQNISRAYRTLRAVGFREQDMFVLSPREEHWPVGREAHVYKPFPEHLISVLDELAETVRPEDLVVIYGTGHGDSDEGESLLELRNGEVFAGDFRADVERIRGRTVVVMDQCFSGGFADVFEGTKNRAVVIATVDRDHMTYCVPFARAFWSAFLHPDLADRNHDGKTSVREAYEVALEAHRRELTGDPELRATAEYRSFNGFDDEILGVAPKVVASARPISSGRASAR